MNYLKTWSSELLCYSMKCTESAQLSPSAC